MFADPAYRWAEASNPLAFLLRWWLALVRWLERLQERHPQTFQLLLWGLLAILVAIFVHAGWLLYRTVRAGTASRQGQAGPAAPAPRGAAWYRQEALRLAGLGRYVEAMQSDFLALVLDLDTRHLVRFHPSKTPREYTEEVQLPGPDRRELGELVRSLYQYAFARAPCGAAEYAAWHQRADHERYAATG